MKRTILLAAFCALTALAAEKPIKLADLPAPLQRAIQAELKGGELKAISKETEKGKTMYEVETTVKGRGRDMIFDPAGTLVEVEEEVAIADIPAPAKAALEKKAVGGKITKVEALTKGGVTTWEAAITKGRKTSEFAVSATGAEVK